jgi:uncharacterized protein (TIGR04255 family)
MLYDAPLVLVLCQLQWNSLASLQDDAAMRSATDKFGKAMAECGYVFFATAKNINYVISPSGVTSNEAGITYQWSSTDNIWHADLSEQVMSFYTTQYQGYEDFKKRLRPIIIALRDIIGVPLINRVGFRYVNRIVDESNLNDLDLLFRKEVLAFQALKLPQLVSSMNQAEYKVDDTDFQVRTGIVPSHQTVDPSIAPVDSQSWVLDLSANLNVAQTMNADEIIKSAGHLSDIDFDYFKRIITPEFSRRFRGGNEDHGSSLH